MQEKFISLLERVKKKHSTLSAAMRAGGVDPTSTLGLRIRRLIEQKASGDRRVKPWDLWALQGLLTFRKKKNPKE